MLKEKYKGFVPNWTSDKTQKYDLLLTDDLDSLMGCAILKSVMGWDIQRVMLFKADKNKTTDYLGKTSKATNEVIGIDIALQHGKCFDNHCSRLQLSDHTNNECVNPNIWENVTRQNYFSKYNSSTALLLWSIYDIPMPKSEDGKMILLAIDGTYQSFYHENSQYNRMNKHYLCDVLGLDELYECQKRHKKSDFEEIKKKYRMTTNGRDTKIVSKKGYLQTELNLDAINVAVGCGNNVLCELPQERFSLSATFLDKQVKLDRYNRNSEKLDDIVKESYSVALTGRDFLCYSEMQTER